jgi:hypothetical protein
MSVQAYENYGKMAETAIISVSATANAAVTKWRNEEPGCVRVILAEVAYGLLIPVGAVETLARLVCCVVLLPVSGILMFLGCCSSKLPGAGIAVGLIATSGVTVSAGTTADALCSAITQICKDEVTLGWTKKADRVGFFKKILL